MPDSMTPEHSDDEQASGSDVAPSDGRPLDETGGDATGADRTQMILTALDQQGRSGANWFYWVAALSIINSAMLLGGANRHFVVGLAATQIVDQFGLGIVQQAPQHSTVVCALAFSINLLIALFVAGFAWLAKRRVPAVFVIGMLLYALDGLLFVFFADWMSAAFHLYVLYCMWSGWSAYRKLAAIEASRPWTQAELAVDGAAPVAE